MHNTRTNGIRSLRTELPPPIWLFAGVKHLPHYPASLSFGQAHGDDECWFVLWDVCGVDCAGAGAKHVEWRGWTCGEDGAY